MMHYKNNSERGFCVFFKEQKLVSSQKTQKIRNQKTRRVGFLKKWGVFSTLMSLNSLS